MRYPDPKNYDCPDDYYDAIEMYEEMQKREKYGYDGDEPEEEEPEYDMTKKLIDTFRNAQIVLNMANTNNFKTLINY